MGIGGLFQPEHPELKGKDCVRTWGNAGRTLNGQLYDPIRAYADKIKLDFMYETAAKELIQSPAGAVVGVKAEAGGKVEEVESLEKQLVSDVRRLRDECEAKKEKLRAGFAKL